MIIAIDFDGTLHSGSWPHIGIPLPHAIETMRALKNDGHYLIIWTCREREYLTAAVSWLTLHEIPFDRINDHRPGTTEQFGYAARKVYADLYIDDKQVGGLPAWDEIYKYVQKLKNIEK